MSPARKKNRSGYVAIIGRTNAGKSTFLNNILDVKVAIVSDKPQTTRKRLLGIKTTPRGQIVFFDSPGIHKPHFKLNERMMAEVGEALRDADLVLYFVDIDDRSRDDIVFSMIQDMKKPVFLVINKIDKHKKPLILDRINYFKDMYPWKEIVPVSALKGDNLDLIEELIFQYLPIGENFYPEEQYTIQSQKYYVSELIREKVLHRVREELPFTTTVRVEEITDRGTILYIRAEILVETESQKKIMVGHRGSLIKEIGEAARHEIEEYIERSVFLDLFVKVAEEWRNSPQLLQDLFE